MGYYIETVGNHNKAQTICEQEPSAKLVSRAEAEAAMVKGLGVVVVVDNGFFEAAAFAYSEREFEEFTRPEDRRPKQYVVMDRKRAELLSGYRMMREEAWQKVWDHFVVNENPPSVGQNADGSTGCKYNGPDGARCAFALQLTPPELAQIGTMSLEGADAGHVIRSLGLKRFMNEDVLDWFYDDLQECHDDAARRYTEKGLFVYDAADFKERIRDNLIELARVAELNVEVTDEKR